MIEWFTGRAERDERRAAVCNASAQTRRAARELAETVAGYDTRELARTFDEIDQRGQGGPHRTQ